jgi:hypothetical protein
MCLSGAILLMMMHFCEGSSKDFLLTSFEDSLPTSSDRGIEEALILEASEGSLKSSEMKDAIEKLEDLVPKMETTMAPEARAAAAAEKRAEKKREAKAAAKASSSRSKSSSSNNTITSSRASGINDNVMEVSPSSGNFDHVQRLQQSGGTGVTLSSDWTAHGPVASSPGPLGWF